MKINPTFTKYCDGCDKADLELEEATSYNFHDLTEGKHWFVRCKHEDACRRIAEVIEKEPEIIRCKDCKYCDRGIDEDGNPFLKCLGWVYGGTQEEDFCSHAERRTDETN